MNFNNLDFLEIGVSFSPNTNICTKIQDDMYGFVIDADFNYLEDLTCPYTVNKIYYNNCFNLIDIFDLYNIISIKYLKIKCNDLNYSIISSLINRNKPINIQKIQFESTTKNHVYDEIRNYLENNHYIYLDGNSDSFFINSKKVSNLICNPDILDQIFLYNLRYNLESDY
jgi:hypothetical protein